MLVLHLGRGALVVHHIDAASARKPMDNPAWNVRCDRAFQVSPMDNLVSQPHLGWLTTSMSNPIIRLGAVSLDAADPKRLATFYQDLLGLEVMFESDDFVALKGASTLITTQRIDDHREPDWPGNQVPKQVHLELAADDLDAAEAFAVSVGARTTAAQDGADHFRVMIDPAGHPFCLTNLIPDD